MSKITPFSLSTPPGSLAGDVDASRSADRPVSGRFKRTAAPGDRETDPAAKLKELESRLSVLETALVEHASILRDRIGQRLDRLEQRFQYEAAGFRRALQAESSDRKTHLIQLTRSVTAAVDRVESNQLAASVQHSLQDLVEALAVTRGHLDALTQAVNPPVDGLAS